MSQAHAAAALALAGIIWFVQLVHYPLFRRAASEAFAGFSRENQRRTSWVVVPLMLVEAITASWLLVLHWQQGRAVLALIGWLLLAAVWTSTGLLQVPLHRRLAMSFDRRTIDRLVASNWIRTAAWSLRAPIALALADGSV